MSLLDCCVSLVKEHEMKWRSGLSVSQVEVQLTMALLRECFPEDSCWLRYYYVLTVRTYTDISLASGEISL